MYQKNLLNNTFSVAIWGSGYLGYYTLIKYTQLGINCVLVDTRYKNLSELEEHFTQLRKNYWEFETHIEDELENCKLTTGDELQANNILVHFICVAVEKSGKPTYENLYRVLEKIKKIVSNNNNIRPLIIIESSFSPGTTEKIIIPSLKEAGKILGKDYLMSVAPRRDWDYNPYVKNISLGRLIGSTDMQSLIEAKQICELVDESVVSVNNFFHVELARCIENSIQYINKAFVNQLFQAFPENDINKVINLAATHPDISEYKPGAGVGGFNLPMSSYFLSESSSVPESLTLLHEAMRTDYEMTKIITEKIISQNVSSVVILGLSYKANARLHLNSPAFKFIELFKNKNIDVKINDPMYTKEEITEITKIPAVSFPDDKSEFDAVLVLTPHSKYKKIRFEKINTYLKNIKLVVDTCETWANYAQEKTEYNYILLGGAKWNL